MKFRELILKARVNRANGQINVNIPKKKLSLKELDKITSSKSIKFLLKENE